MFERFRRVNTADANIYAPVKGECIDITDVEDKVFSSKMMGDGFAIRPHSDIIGSPCSGTITLIFPTKHAFGVSMEDGKEVLIHIGIDTVNLKGVGFEALKRVNDKVRVGEPIIRMNKKEIEKSFDLTTMVIVTEGKNQAFEKVAINKKVDIKDLIIKTL